MITQTIISQLEEIVDKHSLASVLEMLTVICYEKADNINENWQDRPLASIWKQAGNRINSISDKVAC